MLEWTKSLIKGKTWPHIQFSQTKRKFGNVFASCPWRSLNNGPHKIIHQKEWAVVGTNPFSSCQCCFVFGSWIAVIIHKQGCSSVTLPAVMYETVARWAQKRRRLYWEFRSTCANMMDDPMGYSLAGQFLKEKRMERVWGTVQVTTMNIFSLSTFTPFDCPSSSWWTDL